MRVVTASALIAFASFVGATSTRAAETITYTYDAQGRLTNVGHSGTVNNGVQQSYSHDYADNRINVTVTTTPSTVWNSFNWGGAAWHN